MRVEVRANGRPTVAKSVDRICDLIALLRKKPRTIAEIAKLWGIGPNGTDVTVRGYIRALHGEGLIYISGWVATAGRPHALWAWQPEVAAFPDCPKGERMFSIETAD